MVVRDKVLAEAECARCCKHHTSERKPKEEKE